MALTRRRDERGFLYVEVLAAMALLGFVLVTAGALMGSAVRENAAARDLTVASTLAQDKAEALSRAVYAALASGSDVVTVRSMKYTRVWTVADDAPYGNMRTVTVTVTPNRRGAMTGGNRVATIQIYRVPS